MLNKFIRFSAIVFPGGFRFLSVMIAGYFLSENISIDYSKGFFWVVLITSFSGIPISAVMSNRLRCLSISQAYCAVFITVCLFSFISCMVFFFGSGFVFFVNVFLASFFLSLYEVTKKLFFNNEEYHEIFLAAAISTICLIPIVYIMEEFLLAATFFVLFFPVFVIVLFKKMTYQGEAVGTKELVSTYGDFFLSNIFSVSMNSAIPLFLIFLIGDDIAPQMAQVFAISSLLLLLPRSMAIQNIGKLRRSGPSLIIVNNFYRVMKVYLLVIGLITFSLFNILYSDEWLILWMLLFGIQLSQIYVPYSSLLAVEGMARALLIINFKGTVFFGVLFGVLLIFMKDYIAVVFMLSFCIHHAYKLYLTKLDANKILS